MVCDSPTNPVHVTRVRRIDPLIAALCVPSAHSSVNCVSLSQNSFVALYSLFTSDVVYTASPIEDPNAFKGAVVLSPGSLVLWAG